MTTAKGNRDFLDSPQGREFFRKGFRLEAADGHHPSCDSQYGFECYYMTPFEEIIEALRTKYPDHRYFDICQFNCYSDFERERKWAKEQLRRPKYKPFKSKMPTLLEKLFRRNHD